MITRLILAAIFAQSLVFVLFFQNQQSTISLHPPAEEMDKWPFSSRALTSNHFCQTSDPFILIVQTKKKDNEKSRMVCIHLNTCDKCIRSQWKNRFFKQQGVDRTLSI